MRQHQGVDGEKRKYEDLNRKIQYRYDIHIYIYIKIQFIVLMLIIYVL